ncbi:hypothetical protein [Desulfocastanea catecholica]
MRKVELMIFIISIFSLLIGCAQPRPVTLKALSLEGQSLQYNGGRQHIFSKKLYSRVGLDFPTGSISYGSTVDFYIAIVNTSGISFNFSTENITAKCNDKSIYIFHPDEALHDQDSKTAIDLRGLAPSDVTALSNLMVEHQRRLAQDIQNFSKQLLKAQTVPHDSVFGGVVRMAYPSCTNELDLVVVSGTDQHRFKFDLISKEF